MPQGIVMDPLYTPAVCTTISNLLSSAAADGQYVRIWEKMQDALTAAKLGWRQHVLPEKAGVSEANRGRFGVGGSEAHEHGNRILVAGFSWKKAEEATAVEAPPAPWKDSAEAFNRELCDLSEGLIPHLSTLKVLSVGGVIRTLFCAP